MAGELREILAQLGRGRTVSIRTRQGGGIGDPQNVRESEDQHGPTELFGIFVGPESPADVLPAAPDIENEFDTSRMFPFVSSNVEGGYFIRYQAQKYGEIFGDLYLMFQKRRPETPGGRPIGPPRAYVYQNVPEHIWQSLLSANSPGGTVWDVIRRGGIEGDRIE